MRTQGLPHRPRWASRSWRIAKDLAELILAGVGLLAASSLLVYLLWRMVAGPFHLQ